MPPTRDERILSLKPQVEVHSIRATHRHHLSPEMAEDVQSEAWLGAIDAVDRFDPRTGFQLATYAQHRVHGAIQDYFRKIDPLGRHHRQRVKAGELAAPVFVGLKPSMQIKSASLWPGVEARIAVNELLSRARLSPREEQVIRLHYFENVPFEDIAAQQGCGPSRISQLKTSALAKLRAAA